MNINTINSSGKNDYMYNCIKSIPIAIAIIRVDLSLKTKDAMVKFDYINSEFSKLKNISIKSASNISPCSISIKDDNELLAIFYDVAYNKKVFKFQEYDEKIKKYLEIQFCQLKLGFCICIINDMTRMYELEKNNRILKEELAKDELTSLLNRKYFISKTKDFIDSFKNCNNKCALFIIDIDNFKLINDLYGHQCGDEILMRLSSKLKSAFKVNSLIGRLGGDEFIIFMKNVHKIEDIEKKASFLCRHLSMPIKDKVVTCSIGVTILSEQNNIFEELYNQADSAMYTAKKRGKSQYCINLSYKQALL